MVDMHQPRREDVDDHDLTVDAEQNNMLADLVGLAEDNRESGHQIAQHTLQSNPMPTPASRGAMGTPSV